MVTCHARAQTGESQTLSFQKRSSGRIAVQKTIIRWLVDSHREGNRKGNEVTEGPAFGGGRVTWTRLIGHLESLLVEMHEDEGTLLPVPLMSLLAGPT